MVWSANSDSYGIVGQDVELISNPLRFPGQYYDVETGFHYNYHRYYDPVTGRYTQPDPLGVRGGVNLYMYAQQNPINAYDPYGLYSQEPLNPYNPGDWKDCTPVPKSYGTDKIPYSYIKTLSRTWFGITFHNVGPTPDLDKKGKKLGLEADFYNIYVVKKGLITGTFYRPYVEILFFCEKKQKCGPPLKWESGPHKFANGNATAVDDSEPLDTWYAVEEEFIARLPLPIPYRIPL